MTGDVDLAGRQVSAETKALVRNPLSAVFTLAFPVLFLVIFGSLNSGAELQDRGGIRFIQFYVPGIIAFAIIGACFVNLAIRVAVLRDDGVLKRIRGTPLPPSAYLAGHFGASVLVSALLTIVTTGVGVLFYDVRFRSATIPGLLAALVLGATCFCSLGVALTGFIPNGDAAPAVVNIVSLPLLFISGIFFPAEAAPAWMRAIAKAFPVQHFANALQVAFDPRTPGPGFSGTDLAVLAGWTVVGTAAALRWFRWERRSA